MKTSTSKRQLLIVAEATRERVEAIERARKEIERFVREAIDGLTCPEHGPGSSHVAFEYGDVGELRGTILCQTCCDPMKPAVVAILRHAFEPIRVH